MINDHHQSHPPVNSARYFCTHRNWAQPIQPDLLNDMIRPNDLHRGPHIPISHRSNDPLIIFNLCVPHNKTINDADLSGAHAFHS